MRTAGLPSITPAGVVVASGAGAFALLGWSLGHRTLTIVAAGAAAGLVGGWLATLSVPRLDVSRAIEPARVERGRRALGLVSVRNVGRRRSRSCTAVELITNDELGATASTTPLTGRAQSSVTVRVEIPALPARRSVAVPYELPTHRRGALRVGPLAITRRDPFGLWQARRPVGDAVTLLVQPRVHAIDPRRGGRARHLEGPLSDTAPRGTLTFHSLRECTPGDDIRRVHWRSSARTGTLMVREQVDTSLPSTVVVLDTRANRYRDESFEDAVDVAASVVASSQARGFPVRLVTSAGVAFVARAGQRGQDLRDFLTTVGTEGDGSLRRAAIEVLRGREHDVIAVVSGDVDGADLADVTSMTRRFASGALVTVGAATTGTRPRWTAGLHLDGATAAEALARWQVTTTTRSASGLDG
jgi:uncharacterized protein (DUF58 family)